MSNQPPQLIGAALLLLAVFVLCAFIGYLMRRWLSPARAESAQVPEKTPEKSSATPPNPAVKPVPKPVAAATRTTAKSKPKVATKAAKAAPKAAKPAAKTAKPTATRKAKPAAKKATPTKAKAVSAAQPDDLKKIKGIGPKIEGQLNAIGVTNFQQISGWKRADIDRIDAELSFKGRVEREEWIQQAKALETGTK